MRVGAEEQAHLRGLLADIGEIVRQPGENGPGDLPCCNELERVLLPAFLAALRSGCRDIAPAPKQRMARRYQRLRDARDYLAAHRHEPIRVEDLCTELELSERGVENLFQDLVGIGPAAFLRRQRLHYAHRALQLASPGAGKVKKVALEAGFWHLGHFSRNYHQMFGEKPSETRARMP